MSLRVGFQLLMKKQEINAKYRNRNQFPVLVNRGAQRGQPKIKIKKIKIKRVA